MPVGRPRIDRQSPHCREENINCHDCVVCAAEKLALIASDMNSSTVRQIFTAMYPAESCLPMTTLFVQTFHKQHRQACASADREPMLEAAVA